MMQALGFGRQQVGITSEEPSAVRLFAKKRHGVAFGARSFAIGSSDLHREACTSAREITADQDLFDLRIRFDLYAFHGSLPTRLELFLAEWWLAGNNENHVVREKIEHGVHIASARGSHPLINDGANGLFVLRHICFQMHQAYRGDLGLSD